MINFPCPKKYEQLKRVKDGLYCTDCSTTLLDLTNCTDREINQAKTDHPGACVVMRASQVKVDKYGFKRFALALIIVMGSSGFVFGNDQLELSIEEVRTTFLTAQDSLTNIHVAVTNKEGEARYAWARVICENDTVFDLTMDNNHQFSLNLGSEYAGQELIIEVYPINGRVKRDKIKVFDPEEFYYFNFSFRKKQFYRRITGKF